MNITVKRTQKVFTGIDATLASILVECGLVTIKPAAAQPVDRQLVEQFVRHHELGRYAYDRIGEFVEPSAMWCSKDAQKGRRYKIWRAFFNTASAVYGKTFPGFKMPLGAVVKFLTPEAVDQLRSITKSPNTENWKKLREMAC